LLGRPTLKTGDSRRRFASQFLNGFTILEKIDVSVTSGADFLSISGAIDLPFTLSCQSDGRGQPMT
jgi:hypothetical protein